MQITVRSEFFRVGQIADISIALVCRSFDHFVGELLKLPGHVEAQRLRGLEMDDELILGRGLHGQVSGLLAFQNATDVGRSPTLLLDRIETV